MYKPNALVVAISAGEGWLPVLRFAGAQPATKLHLGCVGYAMNREVCPICGIYVSESAGSATSVVSGC